MHAFRAKTTNPDDPISLKKLEMLDGEYAATLTILGFDFNRAAKTFGSRRQSGHVPTHRAPLAAMV
jgi:hypothetical protein